MPEIPDHLGAPDRIPEIANAFAWRTGLVPQDFRAREYPSATAAAPAEPPTESSVVGPFEICPS